MTTKQRLPFWKGALRVFNLILRMQHSAFAVDNPTPISSQMGWRATDRLIDAVTLIHKLYLDQPATDFFGMLDGIEAVLLAFIYNGSVRIIFLRRTI